ncbi:DJ-1 family glyoxalase III [Butyrivibrio sp. YAB3001]|uniref:DJ-1 family glyoxalase III n=1 Tax=Butyrivibrio sp. YAB3001 TaxID=1520812 RepID=UPI0008F67736|nr:DJ-1 family glyoxalase III [Butyrivibrio sp. YAB3001]SFB85611.1 4-methyl-5(b-hydroxyethyl)-thiazole monophosphate biosynthesis [Butyrivibrio sp. YAB3001]
MAKTAIFLADGFEEIEALTVVDLLRRAGIEIITASIMGRKEVTGSHNITVLADALIDDIDFDGTDMLILPGGMPGTTNLGECEPLKEKIKDFDAKEKMLAAICAAPTVYGKMGILSGKKACCYPGCEVDLKGADVQTTEVTKDGHFITSRGMGTAIPFGLAIIAHFQGQDVADKMAEKIVYKS